MSAMATSAGMPMLLLIIIIIGAAVIGTMMLRRQRRQRRRHGRRPAVKPDIQADMGRGFRPAKTLNLNSLRPHQGGGG
jgi:hypothetical protein